MIRSYEEIGLSNQFTARYRKPIKLVYKFLAVNLSSEKIPNYSLYALVNVLFYILQFCHTSGRMAVIHSATKRLYHNHQNYVIEGCLEVK